MSASEGFIINHRGEEVEPGAPRIVALQLEQEEKHFHKINYKKDINVALQKTITFGQPGLVTKADLFEDEAKTILILSVEREYDIEASTGKLLRKKTTRKYYCEDGSVHPETKDVGWYTYTGEESRAATHRRRVNVTNKLEDDMLEILKAAAGGNSTQEEANIAAGALFLGALSPALNVFHISGDSSGIVNFVSDTNNQTTYTFLLADIGGGVLAHQFISAGVTY